MKLRDLLQNLPSHLRRDGELIAMHLLKTRISNLPLLLDSKITQEFKDKFLQLLEKRKEGIPVAYILGEWEFFGRTFKVEEGVLIPRPETELLVEHVLRLIPQDTPAEGYEIGVGSGCISITLLLEREKLVMTACDVNPEALRVARLNAKLHKVEERLRLLEGSLLEPIKGRKFNFIISNPPYIPEDKWTELPPEIKREGKLSLIGGKKGYELFERLAPELKKHLKDGGFVAFEIGHDQGKVVRSLLKEGGFSEVIIYKDYSGQDRVAIAWS